MGPRTLISPGERVADELARRGALLAPFAIPCSLSPLTSRFISDWRRTVSSKFIDTQVPSISTEELVLSRHARCVLSRLRCNGHSLLLDSYLSRIGRIENPSCSACETRPRTSLISFCTVQPRTLCAAHSLATLCLSTTSGPDPGELLGFWGSMVFRNVPISRKGSGKQQQQIDFFDRVQSSNAARYAALELCLKQRKLFAITYWSCDVITYWSF